MGACQLSLCRISHACAPPGMILVPFSVKLRLTEHLLPLQKNGCLSGYLCTHLQNNSSEMQLWLQVTWVLIIDLGFNNAVNVIENHSKLQNIRKFTLWEQHAAYPCTWSNS